MNYTSLLFDLDGTLTDPKTGITNSVRYALSHFGIEVDDTERLESFIGPPLHESFMRFFSFSLRDAWRAVDYYREYFEQSGMYENEVYPGIPELLVSLQRQQKLLYVATSKPHYFARRILVHFGLAASFAAVYGSELDGTRTNKAELIQYVIQQEQLDCEKTVMIGDREYDIRGAKANGIASIAVGYGYGSAEEIQRADPAYYCRTLKQLHRLLLG